MIHPHLTKCEAMIHFHPATENILFPPYKGGIQGGSDQSNVLLRTKNLPQPTNRMREARAT